MIIISIASVIEPSPLLLWQIVAAMLVGSGVSALFAAAILLASTVEVVQGRPLTIRRVWRLKRPALCRLCQTQCSEAQIETQ